MNFRWSVDVSTLSFVLFLFLFVLLCFSRRGRKKERKANQSSFLPSYSLLSNLEPKNNQHTYLFSIPPLRKEEGSNPWISTHQNLVRMAVKVML
ncbi:hypothetical protein M430DRAFT_263930 [Amorphotheca resinae ATCC 22711]|uniref:Uncharacterized protein n=1 Tax=Amorphotheca resinae ATCC 22711 TaxID=857342 RepID=A0A2T3AWJ8_AMORE|nr:hypothetical protein M430DRAFT_263930 [Amorphotheca resinae ATCC 22711]PSS13039.1 hypothetical protein M430DRAFT_263930 [Amorphotheca resinae ATCC 22711]